MNADSGRQNVNSVRRAWTLIGLATAVCITLALVAGFSIRWIYQNATVSMQAEISVINGSNAVWRASDSDDWIVLDGSATVREGTEIATERNTVVWVTLHDGSTIELAEHSHLHFERLRSSRFSSAVDHSQLRLQSGSLHGAFAPAVSKEFTKLDIRTGSANIVLEMDRDRVPAVSPTFLVDLLQSDGLTLRTAALTGSLVVDSESGETRLDEGDQLLVQQGGAVHLTNQIVIDKVQNGMFDDDLEGWEVVYSAESREPESNIGISRVVAGGNSSAPHVLEIARPDSDVFARTGVRQLIESTLRLPAELELRFDVRVDHQGPGLLTRPTLPIVIELSYIDIIGQERTWRSGFGLQDIEPESLANVVDLYTVVERGTWTSVIVDLNNLEPNPKILGELVMYASGTGYRSTVTNVSLTVSE